MYIPRLLEAKVKKYINTKEIIAILGPRQSGKTTIMNKIASDLKEVKFISFEDREILELFVQDIKGFVKLYVEGYKYLFIDEVQYAKDGGKQLKYIYDTHKIKMFISGSSASELSINSIKYLTGRVFLFNLYPLSFEEVLEYKNPKLYSLYKTKTYSEPVLKSINEYYKEFIIFGGYPRVVISKNNDEKIEVLKGIYNTYFLKEIKEILQLPDDFKLSKLIKSLAINCCGLINYDSLSSSTGFDHKDLLKNLNILNKTYITMESKPFFTNKNKELVKTPKYFFLDNGFRNYVLGNFQDVDSRTDAGDLNENFVASEIYKCDFELHYWRTKAKAEVDFIIEKNSTLTPIEVKSTLTRDNLTRSLGNYILEYSPNKVFVLSYDYQDKKDEQTSKVYFKPIMSIRKLLESL